MINKTDYKKGLYIHVPFCLSKCKYCDFNSRELQSQDEITNYLKTIKKQTKTFYRKLGLNQESWDSIYIGGGTPSCLTEEALHDLLSFYIENSNTSFDNDGQSREITVEVNPNSITSEKATILASKVNRISIGLQSTHSKYLKRLGRIHTWNDFIRAYELLVSKGIDNINVDLIYGIPGQRLEDLEQDLDLLTNLTPFPPKHISLYNLTIEEGTPLMEEYQTGELPILDEQSEVSMYNMAREILQDRGYKHYELSNFSKEGYQCRHNLIYWLRHNYLGLGPGAHSLWNSKRFYCTESITDYLKASQDQDLDERTLIQDCWDVSREEALSERIFLGLRLLSGVDLEEISQEFQLDVEKKFAKQIKKLIDQGFLTKTGSVIKLTEKAYMLSNYVFMEFLPHLDK
ncbi:radical SAM family heme chaperone HemW [Natranaerobius thermophilus]|uniref:Heme chaperone HemW n=1 Tax=Natranaerobius thermophilus (strain ATCC BAA-1301 / DSM 18059 / JW/NM-WN-LF) TaxID=457570 RepID=B2A1M6_NATTJ|nr:radical SAM family heme chaperone HemW [Natranaerobius thermophilus]ACB84763.1 oxygen-independent coproporphyrinogen III oxidase [Natranaerobius thermophilus JW/NM-WN-LF]